MNGLFRRIYGLLQAVFERAGIYLAISRINRRNRPEVVNKAIWKPFLVDDRWRSLYKTTQIATKGTATDNIFRQCRFYSTLQMADYAASLAAGDVIECGCWHGHSTVAIATILAGHDFSGRFHVFDSFEGGLSDFQEKDESYFKLSEREKRAQIEQFASSLEFVRLANGAVWLRRATPRLDTPVVRLFCRAPGEVRTHRCGYVRAHARGFGIFLEGTRTRRLYGRG